MSCNACTKRYGFFCKETGCPNCGFSFCTKCLKKEIEVPRCNNAKLKVCLKCYEKLEKEKHFQNILKEQQKIEKNDEIFTINEPVESLTPPLEPLNISARETTPDDNELADNLDSLLTEKLNNLKSNDKNEDDNKDFPNDNDIASRIAALKGIPYKNYTKPDVSLLLSGQKKTESEQITDLLKQFVEEKEIDNNVQDPNYDPIADIERRLAILKGEDPNAPKKTNIPIQKEEENEETETKKLMEKYLEEAKLPDFNLTAEEKEFIEGLPKPNTNTEELPWCTICNEDAVLRCIGCDGDLFCKACYRECHDDEDFREHKSTPYNKNPNFIENHF